jgi:hypothetical protein
LAGFQNLEREFSNGGRSKKLKRAVVLALGRLSETGVNQYWAEKKQWQTPRQMRDLVSEYSDLFAMCYMVEAQYLVLSMSDYLTGPGKLLEMLKLALSYREQWKSENAPR